MDVVLERLEESGGLLPVVSRTEVAPSRGCHYRREPDAPPAPARGEAARS